MTSSTLASFSLSQVSVPTEEELGACPDLCNVFPPWCLKYLEGDHERMLWGVDEHERIARDTPVEPYTDPTLQRNYRQYLRLIEKSDRIHMFQWTLHPQHRVGILFVKKT